MSSICLILKQIEDSTYSVPTIYALNRFNSSMFTCKLINQLFSLNFLTINAYKAIAVLNCE